MATDGRGVRGAYARWLKGQWYRAMTRAISYVAQEWVMSHLAMASIGASIGASSRARAQDELYTPRPKTIEHQRRRTDALTPADGWLSTINGGHGGVHRVETPHPAHPRVGHGKLICIRIGLTVALSHYGAISTSTLASLLDLTMLMLASDFCF